MTQPPSGWAVSSFRRGQRHSGLCSYRPPAASLIFSRTRSISLNIFRLFLAPGTSMSPFPENHSPTMGLRCGSVLSWSRQRRSSSVEPRLPAATITRLPTTEP